jgi:hypothetical protein
VAATAIDPTVVSLIGNTANRGGLLVRARLDRRRYPIEGRSQPKTFVS